MKKVFALALAAAMALSMTACGSGEPEAPAVTYKTGLGAVVEVSATNEQGEKGASAQINTTIAAVTFNSDDVIVSINLDVAQQKASFDLEGQPVGEVDLRTKVEKEGDYGMAGTSPIGKELFEQVNGFENWAKGKTLSEVVGMELGENSFGYKDTPIAEDLRTTTTISMTTFLKAVQKAYDNATETSGVPARTGLGVVISAPVTAQDTANEKGASVQVNTNMMAVALDAEGKVVAAQLDVAQQKVAFDLEGVAGETDLRTKMEKQGDYGMLTVSEIGKEYFEQSKAFTDWMVGKSASEVSGMETFERDPSHTAVPAVEDLKASVTITVGDYLVAFDEAVATAK